VQEAGKDVIRAVKSFRAGLHDTARSWIDAAYERLYEESKWCAEGREEVQRFLNFVVGIKLNVLKLSDLDLSIPASMIYFGRKDADAFKVEIEKQVNDFVEASA